MRSGTRRITRHDRDLSRAVTIVKNIHPRPRIEYKKTSTGELCGYCAEWSPSDAPGPLEMDDIIFKIRRLGFQVLQGHLYPMFDVTSGNGDKGLAVRTLQAMMGTRGGLMFVGDSTADNPAFEVAGLAIGVVNGGRRSRLECDYLVTRKHLAQFFSALLENNLEFSEEVPWILRRK